jgi:hypothetical protein
MESTNQASYRINWELLKVGATVVYLLPSSQAPKDPLREWKGKIKAVYVSPKYNVGAVRVEVLEEGYEGDEELVYMEQISRIENEKEQ